MKIRSAVERQGVLYATVEFPDGLTQTVILDPKAKRKDIRAEAKRLREAAENVVARPDLEDK